MTQRVGRNTRARPAFIPEGVASGGFPYKIANPGSYRSSGNLVVKAADTTAINIDASNVTIDLNGFSIMGPGSSVGPYGLRGVSAVTEAGRRGNARDILPVQTKRMFRKGDSRR